MIKKLPNSLFRLILGLLAQMNLTHLLWQSIGNEKEMPKNICVKKTCPMKNTCAEKTCPMKLTFTVWNPVCSKVLLYTSLVFSRDQKRHLDDKWNGHQVCRFKMN